MLSDDALALVRDAWPEVITILEKPWETLEVMAGEIQALLQSSPYWVEEILQRVEVANKLTQILVN